MRGRIKEDDSSVPAPDGPYAYLRKFRDGGQHEMFGRCPRDGGEIEIVLDGDKLAADHEYFKFGGAGIHRTTGSRPGAPTSRARNISRSACATGPTAPTVTIWSRRPTARWCGTPTATASIMSSSTTTIARCRSGGIASARRQADDVLIYEEQDFGWFTHIHESASGRFCVIAGGDHETSEQRLIDLADPTRNTAAGRGARRGRAIFARRSRRRTVHSHQCRWRHRLQDRHRAAGRARSAPTGAI